LLERFPQLPSLLLDMHLLRRYFPIFDWGANYSQEKLAADVIVAIVVTLMLIPQSLAYALVAGLPPAVGLYASMLPLIVYAVFGTSGALAIGPVAVTSLMTATAISTIAPQGSPEYLGGAIALAFVSGLLLVIMGLLRLGFLANFLGHPVVTGFITASAIQIAAGQVGPLLGVRAEGETFLTIAQSLFPKVGSIHFLTAAIGVGSLGFLLWVRIGLKPLLQFFSLPDNASGVLVKFGPVAAIVATTLAVWSMGLGDRGVSIVGKVPQGLPPIVLPEFDFSLWKRILIPAVMISIVGYVESISVAVTLAAKKRQRVDPDQEMIALGASNIASAVSGSFPVTGGFSRSVVNFDAGAETPAAGAFTAVGIALTTLFLTPLLFYLPKATLAAMIIVAVLGLIDLHAMKRVFIYSRTDFAALAATIVLTLLAGIEVGLLSGVGLSIFLHLFRTSRPHVAVIGQLPGTTHFRNVLRHDVVTDPAVLSLRFDASFYFPNARFLEETVLDSVAGKPEVKHVILACPAVNAIDVSGLESLEAINRHLRDAGISLHLSEVKGPVMDRLRRSHFLAELTGGVHLTHFDAVSSLNPELARRTLDRQPTGHS
jgi:sulfate permease, SulP family